MEKINVCKTIPCPYYKYNQSLGCGRFRFSSQCPLYKGADPKIQHFSLAIFSQECELPIWKMALKDWLANDQRYAEDTELGDVDLINGLENFKRSPTNSDN